MKNIGSLIWGLILVIVGVIWGLNELNITDIDIFFTGWWTLFIIIPSIAGLIKDENKTGSIIWLLIGVLLFLGVNDIIDFDMMWSLLFPIIIIIIGLSILCKNIFNKGLKEKIRELNKIENKNKKEITATFSSEKINFEKEKFTSCDASAIFGGVELDLRNATFKDSAVINVTAIFGGIDILVPKDVTVIVNSTSIFGGISNERKETLESKHTLYVNGTCLFGGVEIK